MFSFPFGSYRYIRLPYVATLAGDMFQKIGELFSGMSNVYGIADDILIEGFNEQGNDHDETLEKVLQICRQVNLLLNTDKCLFRCPSIPFFCEIISQQGVSTDSRKVKVLMHMQPPKIKKGLQLFLGIINYLS